MWDALFFCRCNRVDAQLLPSLIVTIRSSFFFFFCLVSVSLYLNYISSIKIINIAETERKKSTRKEKIIFLYSLDFNHWKPVALQMIGWRVKRESGRLINWFLLDLFLFTVERFSCYLTRLKTMFTIQSSIDSKNVETTIVTLSIFFLVLSHISSSNMLKNVSSLYTSFSQRIIDWW